MRTAKQSILRGCQRDKIGFYKNMTNVNKTFLLAGLLLTHQANALAEIQIATDQSTLLYSTKASTTTGALETSRGRYVSWKGDGAMGWEVSVPSDGLYELFITANVMDGTEGVVIKFKADQSKHDFRLSPSGGAKIGGRRFERLQLSANIPLAKGRQKLEFSTDGAQADRVMMDLRSLELLPVSARDKVAAENARALASRASVEWLDQAGYGVMFHWTSQSVQPDGTNKTFAEAVKEFDVERFASMVSETGAGYVIFTIGHAESYCPAPIASWENCHPGKTTQRDLIEEIADALNDRGVRLLCYINAPLGFGFKTDHSATEDEKKAFVSNYTSILSELGSRYKHKIAGYWFDSWYQIFEEFPDVPFEDFFKAAKVGNKERIISLNSWIYPPVTPWQDYWAGEVGSPVAVPVNGYLPTGPVTSLPYQALLIMEPYWVRQKLNMPEARFTSDDLSRYIINCMQNQGAVTINLGIYQDGTVGEKALQIMREIKHKVRNKPVPNETRASGEGIRGKTLQDF